MPSPGRIHFYREPSLPAVRTESAAVSGAVIYPDFDPLVSKVIARGENREEAIEQLQHALQQIVITGVRHNIPLIQAILADEEYRRNEVSTTYLQEKYQLFNVLISTQKKKTEIQELITAGALICLFSAKNKQTSLWKSLGYWRFRRQ